MASGLDQVREEYESSLSWRVTRPLRAVGRTLRAISQREPEPTWTPPPGLTPGRYDSWLEIFHGERLARIDRACAEGGSYALFKNLDLDLWALLLTQEYEVFPNIRSFLPGVPDPAIQELWNGASGAALASQTKAFYEKLRATFSRHSDVPLAEAKVLDFGCGWGRVLRLFARDVDPARLYGCDPVDSIVEACREMRVPATFARTDFLPERPPFSERFDLAFSFSVFTHLSEEAHERCLAVIHESLAPGGILVLTVRPPEYLVLCELMHPLLESLGGDYGLEEPRYLFVPHEAAATHPQYAGGAMTYGETVVTPAYMRERWSALFELLDFELLIGDLHQVVVTLRRR